MLRDFSKLWGARLVQTLLGIATLASLLRLLPPVEYGIFALSVSVAGVLAGIAQFGLSSGVSKLINDALALEPRRALPLFLKSIAIQLAAFTVVAAVGAAGLSRLYPEAYADEPVLILAVVTAVFATVGSEHYLRIARTMDDFGGIALHQVTMALARLLGAVGVYWATGSLSSTFFAYAVLQVVLVITYLVRLYRRLRSVDAGPGVPPLPSISGVEILLASAPFFVIGASNVVFAQVGQLVLGSMALTSLATFDVAARLTNALRSPAVAFSFAISARFGREVASDEHGRAARSMSLTLNASALGIPIACGLFFSAPWALWLLGGAEYLGAERVVVALVPYFVGAFASDAVSLSLDYAGRAGRRAAIAVGTATLQVLLTLFLAPRFGAVGVAAALSVSTLVQAGLYLYILSVGVSQLATRATMQIASAGAVCLLPFVALPDGALGVAVRVIGAVGAAVWLALTLLRLRKKKWES